MKKRREWDRQIWLLKKLLRIMKLTSFLILVFVVSVSASGYSQATKLSISVKNGTFVDVLKQIESQSEYYFYYNNDEVSNLKDVSISVKDQKIQDVLDKLLSGTDLEYKIIDRYIALKKKKGTNTEQPIQQQKPVSGKVTDSSEISLPGVSVVIKGTNIGTITDNGGNFRLYNVPSDAILVFKFMGMKTQEVKVGSQSVINTVMTEEAIDVGEVTVTALGIKRETAALGYSVSEIKGKELSVAKEANVMNSLSGRVAGLDISSTIAGPSGSTRVIIRGNSQLAGTNMPLFVVDGVPMDNTQLGSAEKWGGYDMGDGLSGINADDVESISVLKGPSASALYGSRASNGVILITTKTGSTQNGIGVEFSSNTNIASILSKFDDYQTVYGQGRNGLLPLADDIGSSQSAWGPKLDPTLNITIYNGKIKPYGVVQNNILDFFRTGLTLDNSLSFSGGNKDANLRLSLSNLKNNDIVPNSDMNRNTFMLKGTEKLGKKVTIDAKVNYITEKVNNRPALSDNPNNVGLALIGIPANFDQKWLGESYIDSRGQYIDWNRNIYRINPYWSINQIKNESSKERLMGYMQFNYAVNDWLNIQLKTGLDYYNFRFTNFLPKTTPSKEAGYINETTQKVQENNSEFLIKIDKRFLDKKLSFSAYAGGNIMKYRSERFMNEGNGIINPGVESISNFTQKSVNWYLINKQINSLYGAIETGYNDLVFLDLTLRNDWSSTLAKGENSYLYPSVSSSFIFSKLLTGKRNILSFGKVRASWAEVGGDTDPYQLNLTYDLLNYSYNGYPLGKVANSSIPNKLLKPTRTYSYEFGTNLKFFNNRAGLDLTYYSQQTKDQIMQMPISDISGYNYATINAGEITNKGIELTLNLTPVKTADFRWDMDITYSKNKNKVVKLYEGIHNLTLSEARWSGATISAQEGQAYGVIMGRPIKRAPDGQIIINSAGLPEFEDSPAVLGNGTFKWTGGIMNSFSYKSFSLKTLLDIKWGASIFSMSDMLYHINGNSTETLEGRDAWYASEEARMAAGKTPAQWTPISGYVAKGVVNTGTQENPVYVANTTYVDPQVYWNNFYNGSPEPFIKDDSFIKLREVSLSYNFSKKILAKTPFTSVSFSVVGRNLLILYTKLKNIDPESNYNNGNGQGFEYGSLPSRRYAGINLNIKF
ncbi:MAG: SusC/RagA family TonB-linked outer membrane protein [Prolixibacteraceae bacterium]|jgi:TonB-linked SusC/RagA family outer membrane protein